MHGMEAGADKIEHPEQFARRRLAGLDDEIDRGDDLVLVVGQVFVALDREKGDAEEYGRSQQTRPIIWACPVPQSSEHSIRYSPVLVALNQTVS
jgi:hypothetical protein